MSHYNTNGSKNEIPDSFWDELENIIETMTVSFVDELVELSTREENDAQPTTSMPKVIPAAPVPPTPRHVFSPQPQQQHQHLAVHPSPPLEQSAQFLQTVSAFSRMPQNTLAAATMQNYMVQRPNAHIADLPPAIPHAPATLHHNGYHEPGVGMMYDHSGAGMMYERPRPPEPPMPAHSESSAFNRLGARVIDHTDQRYRRQSPSPDDRYRIPATDRHNSHAKPSRERGGRENHGRFSPSSRSTDSQDTYERLQNGNVRDNSREQSVASRYDRDPSRSPSRSSYRNNRRSPSTSRDRYGGRRTPDKRSKRSKSRDPSIESSWSSRGDRRRRSKSRDTRNRRSKSTERSYSPRSRRGSPAKSESSYGTNNFRGGRGRGRGRGGQDRGRGRGRGKDRWENASTSYNNSTQRTDDDADWDALCDKVKPNIPQPSFVRRDARQQPAVAATGSDDEDWDTLVAGPSTSKTTTTTTNKRRSPSPMATRPPSPKRQKFDDDDDDNWDNLVGSSKSTSKRSPVAKKRRSPSPKWQPDSQRGKKKPSQNFNDDEENWDDFVSKAISNKKSSPAAPMPKKLNATSDDDDWDAPKPVAGPSSRGRISPSCLLDSPVRKSTAKRSPSPEERNARKSSKFYKKNDDDSDDDDDWNTAKKKISPKKPGGLRLSPSILDSPPASPPTKKKAGAGKKRDDSSDDEDWENLVGTSSAKTQPNPIGSTSPGLPPPGVFPDKKKNKIKKKGSKDILPPPGLSPDHKTFKNKKNFKEKKKRDYVTVQESDDEDWENLVGSSSNAKKDSTEEMLNNSKEDVPDAEIPNASEIDHVPDCRSASPSATTEFVQEPVIVETTEVEAATSDVAKEDPEIETELVQEEIVCHEEIVDMEITEELQAQQEVDEDSDDEMKGLVIDESAVVEADDVTRNPSDGQVTEEMVVDDILPVEYEQQIVSTSHAESPDREPSEPREFEQKIDAPSDALERSAECPLREPSEPAEFEQEIVEPSDALNHSAESPIRETSEPRECANFNTTDANKENRENAPDTTCATPVKVVNTDLFDEPTPPPPKEFVNSKLEISSDEGEQK